MTEIERITDELHRMYHGNAWHGPSLMEALQGVSAAQAGARPVPGAHSIYELTHHVAAWIGEVHDRLRGKKPGDPADGDFPPPNQPVDEAAWQEVCRRLEARHHALMEAIARFDASRLDTAVDPAASPQSGSGVSFAVMLHGVAQHNGYHAGQMVLLRKALQSERR